MTIWQSIILGIVEGITEFLPVSSTAHLLISADLLKIPSSDFLKSFTISIQLGAILSVAILYLKTIWRHKKLILKIAAAFLPTAIIGLAAYGIIRGILMENLVIIASALIIGGVFLIILENRFKKKFSDSDDQLSKLTNISYKQAVLIGVCQSLAIIPGVSRSAATIMGGLSLGLNRRTIVEFSFMLALPVMLAATILDFYKTPITLTNQEWLVWGIGFIISFIVAVLSIKFLLHFIKNNDFKIFGWYRIVIGTIILAIYYLA